MVVMAPKTQYFSVASLTKFSTDIFAAAGLSRVHAAIEAENLIHADLRGHAAHGVTRIPIYTKRLDCEVVNRSPNLRIEERSDSVAIVHGDNGPGAVVSDFAMKEAIRRAQSTGSGVVVARNSNHNGPCSFYSTQATDLSLIGASSTNSPVSMTVWGSRDRALGTNPFSIGVPAGRHPAILVDMASSVIARGKIVEAAKRGEQIPEGLALSPDGSPTTDAKSAEAGVVLPFAGPKGSAIAILVDLLCGVLSGAAFSKHVNNLYNEFKEPQNNGQFFLAVDPELFMPREEFLARVDQFIDLLKDTPLAQGFDQILMPGEPELQREADFRRTGIPLANNVVDEITSIGASYGIKLPESAPVPFE
jgi:LDH2 family malate/lactate/ureidoglycolate dehydrogenase